MFSAFYSVKMDAYASSRSGLIGFHWPNGTVLNPTDEMQLQK